MDKVKKPRAKKQSTAEELMKAIQPQILEVKVGLYGLLRDSIDADKKVLEDQLALLKGI
jgi:hypothetical protein